MEGDPLRETLDGLLPADEGAPAAAPEQLPPAVVAVCRALAEEPGIADVTLGRQVGARPHMRNLESCFRVPQGSLPFSML